MSVHGAGRATVNQGMRRDRVPGPAGGHVTAFHRRLPGYAPTPVRSLPRVAKELGVHDVGLKDESDRFGLPAFKILGAAWAVEQTLREQPATRTLIAASAGNHGRAVARCAAQRGLGCRIHLPAGTSAARAGVIAAEGADVVYAAGDYDDAAAAADADARTPGGALIADFSPRPGVPSPAWVIDGYATLFHEVSTQQRAPTDLVLVPVGVGSLAAAAVRWAVHEDRHAHVIGVEPTTAACVTQSLRAGEPVTVPTHATSMTGLNCATPSAAAWPTLHAGLAGTLAVDDGEVHQAMRDLAALGLAIGDCGAATLAALRRLVNHEDCGVLRAAVGLGTDSRVLCIGTEGPTDLEAYRAVVA